MKQALVTQPLQTPRTLRRAATMAQQGDFKTGRARRIGCKRTRGTGARSPAGSGGAGGGLRILKTDAQQEQGDAGFFRRSRQPQGGGEIQHRRRPKNFDQGRAENSCSAPPRPRRAARLARRVRAPATGARGRRQIPQDRSRSAARPRHRENPAAPIAKAATARRAGPGRDQNRLRPTNRPRTHGLHAGRRGSVRRQETDPLRSRPERRPPRVLAQNHAEARSGRVPDASRPKF